MTTYRLDWAPTDNPDGTNVIFLADRTHRTAALSRAARLSRKPDSPTVYCIATDDTGQDTGQRVYVRGMFSHQDGAF